MPIYIFKCNACDKVSERLVKIGTETTDCEVCGVATTKQIAQTGGFILTGSDWYKQSPVEPKSE